MDDRRISLWKNALKHYQQTLRTGIIVKNFLPVLRSLLTDVEYQVIADKQLQGNVAMVDELITILLTKESTHFAQFCTVLRESDYAHWAGTLQNYPRGVVNAGTSLPPSVNLEQQYTLSAVDSRGSTLRHNNPPPSSVPARKGSLTESLGGILQPTEHMTVSQESISSTSVQLSYVEEEAESDASERTLEQIGEELLQIMDGLAEDSIPCDNCIDTIDDRVEQSRWEIQSIFSDYFSEVTAGLREATEDKALVWDKLYPIVAEWQDGVRQLINHRTTGTAFTNWASAADKVEKKTATARVVGYSTAISGGVVFAVGSGLVLGGVTAPAGIPLIVIGGVVGAAGSIAALSGCVTKFKMTKSLKKKALQWLKDHQILCRSLIDAHDHLMERKAQVEREYPHVNVNEKLIKIFNTDIPQALDGVDAVVKDWKKAIQYGPEEAVNLIAAAFGGGATIAQGVIDGLDTGSEVVTVAVKATAKLAGASVAVGLSAIMICVDIGLLAKASYDLHKSRKGKSTVLAVVMNEVADEIERETRTLKACCPFADQ